MRGREPDAAVTRRCAELFGLIRAVDSVANFSEENRMRHRCVVPFFGIMVRLHTKSGERARRRGMADATGRNRPSIECLSITRDGHMLGPFINFDEDSACAVPATATAKRADSSKAAMRRIDIISAALPLPEPQVTRVG